MNKKFEQYAPFGIAAAFTLAAICFGINVAAISNFDQILNAVINITAILLGFLGAMMSILIVSSSKRVVKMLRECNLIDCFNSYFKCAVEVGILSAFLSVIFLGVAKLKESCFQYVFFYVWLLFTIWFMTSATRILYIMLQILSSVLKDKEE